MRKSLLLLLGFALLVACGGGDSSPTAPAPVPTPAPTPVPCTQTVLFQGAGSIPARTVDYESFSVTSTGRIDIIVDWTFLDSTIGVYLVRAGTCPISLFNLGLCNFLVNSDNGPKPRRHSYSGATPGAYQMLLANYETYNESLSTQVFLRSSNCPPQTSHAAMSLAHRPKLEAVQ